MQPVNLHSICHSCNFTFISMRFWLMPATPADFKLQEDKNDADYGAQLLKRCRGNIYWNPCATRPPSTVLLNALPNPASVILFLILQSLSCLILLLHPLIVSSTIRKKNTLLNLAFCLFSFTSPQIITHASYLHFCFHVLSPSLRTLR